MSEEHGALDLGIMNSSPILSVKIKQINKLLKNDPEISKKQNGPKMVEETEK